MTLALRFSSRADEDLDAAIDYYVTVAGGDVARGFIEEVEALLVHIVEQPHSGSTRYAVELGIDGLRSFAMQRHPYLIFCRVRPEDVEVWRVLHSSRDIPDTLR